MSQRSELIQTIQDIENGLAMNPTGEILERLTSRLARAKAKLDGLDEKKSTEPSANQGQLPQEIDLDAGLKEIAKREWPKIKAKLDQIEPIPVLPSDLQSAQSLLDKWEKEGYNYQIVGTVTKAPVITVPVVEIALSSGTKQMNRVEIMNMLKTWFKRVATSRAMEKGLFSDAYGGAMGQDTYKLFQGWNTIYNETQEGAAWPPLEDVFPGLGRASQSQKVNAEILWRWASNDK